MTWHTPYRRRSGPRGRCGWARKISLPPMGFDPRNIQPAANRLNTPHTSKHEPNDWLTLMNVHVQKQGTAYCIKPCREGGSVIMYYYVRSRHETDRWPRICGETRPQSAAPNIHSAVNLFALPISRWGAQQREAWRQIICLSRYEVFIKPANVKIPLNNF